MYFSGCSPEDLFPDVLFYFNEGVYLLNSAELKREECDFLKEHAPTYFQHLKNKSRSAHDDSLAAALFGYCIGVQPQFMFAYYFYAVAHGNSANGYDENAWQGYTEVLKFLEEENLLFPNKISNAQRDFICDIYQSRGMLTIWGGEVQTGIADLSEAMKYTDDLYYLYANRGALKFERLKNTEEAMADYMKAIQIDPQNPYAYSKLGELHVFNGDYWKGLEGYNKAISLNPDECLNYHKRADIWRMLNQESLALQDDQIAQEKSNLELNAKS